jgi:hypothetical protein
MRTLPDRYKTVGRRDFQAALEYLLETEFKLVGSHRIIRLISESVMELVREFYPESRHLEPGTVLWGTTKAGDQARVSWGKRAESYGVQMVLLPLVTKAEIESRMYGGPGHDSRDNQRKEFRRDTATLVRLVKSAAAQGGLLSGAELSVLMNRSLMKVHDYIRTHEQETGDPLPMKGYVLDQGSSPTHKGIICRKLEEGMSPPDIARATGHTLTAVDNYLGAYNRIKVLLRKGMDVPTICQITNRAARTVAQYLVIIEQFHPELLGEKHRSWLEGRRNTALKTMAKLSEKLTPGSRTIGKRGTCDTHPSPIAPPTRSGEVVPTARSSTTASSPSRESKVSRNLATGHVA